MNKQIKKSLLKACRQASEEAPSGSSTYESMVYEKFAELLIRECCDMVNKHVQWNNPNDCLLVLDIKEHFGVEE